MNIMKRETRRNDVEKQVYGTGTTFNLKASPEAFAILSSGLYTYKAQAIVRELASNAYDSHIAAGKGDVPITIIAPTPMNPVLKIIDEGTGMSPEDAVRILTVFFESTKKDNPNAIGELGLGSKSPMCYTDSYTVEVRWQGRIHYFSVYINEEGLPDFQPLGEADTAEPNGMTVSIGIRAADINEFQQACLTQTRYFATQPDFRGTVSRGPSASVEYEYKTETWGLRKSTGNSGIPSHQQNRSLAVVKIVPYELNIRSVAEFVEANSMFDQKFLQFLKKLSDSVVSRQLDIFCEVEEVRPAASREQLQYDKMTLNNLAQKLHVFYTDLFEIMNKLISSCKTKFEARNLVGLITGQWGYSASAWMSPIRSKQRQILLEKVKEILGIDFSDGMLQLLYTFSAYQQHKWKGQMILPGHEVNLYALRDDKYDQAIIDAFKVSRGQLTISRKDESNRDIVVLLPPHILGPGFESVKATYLSSTASLNEIVKTIQEAKKIKTADLLKLDANYSPNRMDHLTTAERKLKSVLDGTNKHERAKFLFDGTKLHIIVRDVKGQARDRLSQVIRKLHSKDEIGINSNSSIIMVGASPDITDQEIDAIVERWREELECDISDIEVIRLSSVKRPVVERAAPTAAQRSRELIDVIRVRQLTNNNIEHDTWTSAMWESISEDQFNKLFAKKQIVYVRTYRGTPCKGGNTDDLITSGSTIKPVLDFIATFTGNSVTHIIGIPTSVNLAKYDTSNFIELTDYVNQHKNEAHKKFGDVAEFVDADAYVKAMSWIWHALAKHHKDLLDPVLQKAVTDLLAILTRPDVEAITGTSYALKRSLEYWYNIKHDATSPSNTRLDDLIRIINSVKTTDSFKVVSDIYHLGSRGEALINMLNGEYAVCKLKQLNLI